MIKPYGGDTLFLYIIAICIIPLFIIDIITLKK